MSKLERWWCLRRDWLPAERASVLRLLCSLVADSDNMRAYADECMDRAREARKEAKELRGELKRSGRLAIRTYCRIHSPGSGLLRLLAAVQA